MDPIVWRYDQIFGWPSGLPGSNVNDFVGEFLEIDAKAVYMRKTEKNRYIESDNMHIERQSDITKQKTNTCYTFWGLQTNSKVTLLSLRLFNDRIMTQGGTV